MNPIPELSPIALRIIQLLHSHSSPFHLRQILTQLIVNRLHYDTRIALYFVNSCQSEKTLLSSAFTLFTQFSRPHIFTCNILLKAFSDAHMFSHTLSLYSQMNKNSVLPNNYTFPVLLKSISDEKELKLGQSVHTQIVKSGHLYDVYVQNSLLNLYASCGGEMRSAHKVFDELPERDAVSWTVLISGNRSAGDYDEALIAFQQMHYAGVEPSRVTMVSALAACAGLKALEMGIWIHNSIRKNGWELDLVLGTALVDMYAKCGRIQVAMEVFKEMDDKNAVTWNALIKGLELCGHGKAAVCWFFEMEKEGVRPNEVTLLTVLRCCRRLGLVEFGREIFGSLVSGKYGFRPEIKHYSCMIDLFTLAGCLKEAVELMGKMPFEPTKAILGALLDECRAHRELGLCEVVAWKMVEIEPDVNENYVVLANLYGQMGRKADVERVRDMMESKALSKFLEVCI